MSTASFLARQGVRVALCEKGHIAGEQSGPSWGWVRQQGRDAREMPMIIESLKIWRGVAEAIGEDVGFEQTGCLYAARTDDELGNDASWLPTAREHGLDRHMVSGDEIAQLAPVRPARGSVGSTGQVTARPNHKAAPAIARAAARNGVSILTACAVRGIETQSGRVSAATFRFALRYLPAFRREFGGVRLSNRSRVHRCMANPSALATRCAVAVREDQGAESATTPDAVPEIDEAEGLLGFYIATGLSGHGFGIGPGTGKAIAGLLTGADVYMDLSQFQLGRFFDGTAIRLRPDASKPSLVR